MSEMFLGSPSESIKEWCKRHYYAQMPMTIEALEDNTELKIFNGSSIIDTSSFKVSSDGNNWAEISWKDIGSANYYNVVQTLYGKDTLSKGDKVIFKDIDIWSPSTTSYVYIWSVNGSFKLYGSLSKSLTDSFKNLKHGGSFAQMFRYCSALKSAKYFIIDDDMTIGSNHFQSMFHDCSCLVDAPILQKHNLSRVCYNQMFMNCTALKDTPELPATVLNVACYNLMFAGCSALTGAPVLHATKINTNCYSSMFASCYSLVNAPELPANDLCTRCYYKMFNDCTSLENAPKLSAVNIGLYSYENMFANCKNVKELHYPKSFKDNAPTQFNMTTGKPWFGADQANIYYDL